MKAADPAPRIQAYSNGLPASCGLAEFTDNASAIDVIGASAAACSEAMTISGQKLSVTSKAAAIVAARPAQAASTDRKDREASASLPTNGAAARPYQHSRAENQADLRGSQSFRFKEFRPERRCHAERGVHGGVKEPTQARGFHGHVQRAVDLTLRRRTSGASDQLPSRRIISGNIGERRPGRNPAYGDRCRARDRESVPDVLHERCAQAIDGLAVGQCGPCPARYRPWHIVLNQPGLEVAALWPSRWKRRSGLDLYACADQAALHIRSAAAGRHHTPAYRSRLCRVPESSGVKMKPAQAVGWTAA